MDAKPIRELKLMFSNADLQDIPVLNRDAVARIPKPMFERTIGLGSEQSGSSLKRIGDLAIVTIQQDSHHPTLQRVAQFIKSGEYDPFSGGVTPVFHVTVDHSGRDSAVQPITYSAEFHAGLGELKGDRVTSELVGHEITLYFDCLVTGFADLARVSANKLITRYPVFADQVASFLDNFLKLEPEVQANIDTELLRFFIKRAEICKYNLFARQSLLDVLRDSKVLSDVAQVKALVPKAGGLRLRELRDELRKDLSAREETKLLFASYVSEKMMPLTAPAATTTIAPATQAAVVADHTGALRAFQDGIFPVALEQGYGTLTRTKDGPHGNGDKNARFRYKAGQLFAKVAAAAPQINQDPDTIIIENDYSQIGEVYGKDFMPCKDFIPQDLQEKRERKKQQQQPRVDLNRVIGGWIDKQKLEPQTRRGGGRDL